MPAYPKVQIRTDEVIKARWEEVLSVFDGSGGALLEQALDAFERKNRGMLKELGPEEKALSLVESLMETLKELMSSNHERESALSSALGRIRDLEKAMGAIDSMKKAHADREAQLLGEIHGLRQDAKELQSVREELLTVRAENQALKRERLDLKKQLKVQPQ
jgi:signal transduction histidine kinase